MWGVGFVSCQVCSKLFWPKEFDWVCRYCVKVFFLILFPFVFSLFCFYYWIVLKTIDDCFCWKQIVQNNESINVLIWFNFSFFSIFLAFRFVPSWRCLIKTLSKHCAQTVFQGGSPWTTLFPNSLIGLWVLYCVPVFFEVKRKLFFPVLSL